MQPSQALRELSRAGKAKGRNTARAGIAPSPRALLSLDSAGILPRRRSSVFGTPGGLTRLERLNVRSLPTLGPLHHVELHGLTFLQTLETTRVDCRVMHEHVFAVLTRDKAEALRVVKPLHSTLFHLDACFLN